MGNVMTELERNSKQQSSRAEYHDAKPTRHDHTPATPKKSLPESTWVAIIKDNNFIKSTQQQKVNEILSKGVYWDSRKKKYWVDGNGNNCFMIFANGLKITWSDNPNYWYLQKKSELGDENITIAQLRNVAWLEVHGKFNTEDLTQGVWYEVWFIVKLERTSYGWEVPVNFKLTLPGDKSQNYKLNMKDMDKEKWFEIRAGKFMISKDNEGVIQFSLFEYDGGSWKRGLIIKGAVIKPMVDKNNTNNNNN
ncbi:uncharacterized protein PHLOEM PROTEIN 2-LIKE A4-like [Chenopodium quinoa]|uniref:uncharacterized protein PHLOEM PROTEIN 2-LIKE A4-like n=1 Tax=Chenopodium quinoa TaxID=63459 RepID=UPI000B771C89|nr:uncharacterized protein PHLOEM PROTEIN 2-LIKE A4-like [Chenopodium quinoa]